jgi:hypothetical protein
VYTSIDSFKYQLTAGRAKKEIAKTAKQEATIFPTHVWGTLSPYPIVITVIYKKWGEKRFIT